MSLSTSWKMEEPNRAVRREKGLLLYVGALLLLFGIVSLTTLAKIVTYTPYPCSRSVQYASQSGRRAVPNFRRVGDKKAVLAESAARARLARPNAGISCREFQEPLPSFAPTPGVIPLRSPPSI